MNPPEAYLAELRDIRASGAAVPETSGYGALANLLNEVGGKLKPKVRCLINLRNAGAGIPDGGLFTASQFPKGAHAAAPLVGQMPGRGALEVKPVADDVRVVCHRLHLEGAAPRHLPRQRLRPALGELVCREQPAVGDAGAGVLQVDEAAHLRPQLAADLIQQVGQGAVTRSLGHGGAGGADVAQFGEVGLRRVHRPTSLPAGADAAYVIAMARPLTSVRLIN